MRFASCLSFDEDCIRTTPINGYPTDEILDDEDDRSVLWGEIKYSVGVR